MKNTIRQVSRSPRFMFGFCVFLSILIFMFLYPLFNPGDPLERIGIGTFFKPGTYVSMYDAANTQRTYTLRLSDAAQKRIDGRLMQEDRESMKTWLVLYGIPEDEVDIENTEALTALWWANYDSEIRLEGLKNHERTFYRNLDRRVDGLLDTDDILLMKLNIETGEYEEAGSIKDTDYVNVKEVANVLFLPLGTDNFGRDVLKQLVSATATSLQMGVIAGTIATLIGLVLGLLSGYLGGFVDDGIQFVNNLLTVIPGFILLVLISYGIGQEKRGATTVAVVIGLTSWVWTARSVRAQVISLRNRDHVNLSKLSGHSLARIIVQDILPYIASYVVMAFILQLSSAILAEAGLSMLGLGPKTTEQATLGLMMNWSFSFGAHINGAWWAYYPIVLLIGLISFSLNLMNTGLDQIFNPQLRD